MLDVTVKTLDSNTRNFSVEDDITVKDFKEKIASSVNIPATTQRLIFRGRVLKDDKKLSEYQCHGQVIHLVEKPPPTSTTGSTSRSSSSRSDGQNNFFLGAVHLPAEVTDPTEIQQTVQQVLSGMGDLGRNARVTSRSSADGSSVDVHINLGPIAIQTPLTPAQLRMNQIRSMLRQANTAINTLEATLRGNSSSGTVSSSGNNYHPTTSASSTPQTQSRSSTTSPRQLDSTSSSFTGQSSGGSSQSATSSTTPETSGTTNTNQAGPQAAQTSTQTPLNPRATELAEVLSEIFSLERRLRPFMDRYYTLLVDQPVFETGSEELRRARAIQNVCCQVMHYISHIYHSMSDYNVCMLSRPPRVATVSSMPPPIGPIHFLGSPIPMPRGNTGNVSHQANAGQSTSNTTGAAPGAPRPAGQTSAGAPRPTATPGTTGQTSQPGAPRMPTGPTRPQMGPIRPNARAQPMGPRPIAGFGPRGPLRPQAVRFTFPADGSSRTFHIRGPQIEIRQMSPSGNGGAPQGATPLTPHMMHNIAQVIMQQIQQVGRTTAPTTPPTTTTSAPTSATTSNNTGTAGVQPQTTTAGQRSTSTTTGSSDSSSSGQQGNVPRTVRVQVTHHGQAGQPGGPSVRVRLPPGVRVQTSSTTGRQGAVPTSTTTASAAPRQQSPSTPVGGSNNTSSTNTTSQSGPRPMPQMNALVGGMWDPFLPCHSRHRNANRGDAARTPQRQTGAPRQAAQQQQAQTPLTTSLPGMSNVADMISGVMNALSTQMGAGPSTGSGSSSTPGPSSSQFRDSANFLSQMFDQMSYRNTSPENPQTLEQLFSPFATFGEQHGFLNEMAGALYRVLRVNDFSQIMSGNSEPLRRIRPTIVDFINTRILQGSAPTPTNIRTSARRILTESRGEFSEMLGTEPTHHDIDALATYCYFFEEVLVDVMTITVGDNAASDSDYGDRLVDNLQHSIHAGVQLTMYMYGGEAEMRTFINNRLHAWSSSIGIPGGEMLGRGTTSHLNRITENMCVTEGEIMRYVIKNGEQPPTSGPTAEGTGSSNSSDTMETARESSFESMEVDGQPAAAGSSSSPDSSQLPAGWEAVVPPSWVPVMTQDIQRQRRQAPQGPFSNAYIHGLPHKRIKLEQERRSRPTEGTPSFIRETLRRAVENSGVQPRTTVDSLLQEAESNAAIHSACDEQMKSALKQRMRADPDYDPNKFPNTDKYLQK